MFNYCHYLKGNKRASTPRRYLFFDTETYITEKNEGFTEVEFKLAVANYVNRRNISSFPRPEVRVFKKKLALADFVASKTRPKEPLYVYASNLWFDLRVSNMLKYLHNRGWEVKSFFQRQKVFVILVVKGNRKIKFLNVQNVLPFGVKELGEWVGLEKLGIDFDKCTEEELIIYCKRDTEIIREAILEFHRLIHKHDLGNIAVTLASQALNAFTHRFMEHKILIHKDEHAQKLEGESYHGGRTEMFFKGELKKPPYYLYDVNSMYPFVMSEYSYPSRFISFLDDCTIQRLDNLLRHHCVIANVLLETKENAYPLRKDAKLIFPVGKFRATLCTGSLIYALEHGHIKEISKMSLYRKAPIFKGYIKGLYALKLKAQKKGNHQDYTIFKLLLNTLYGKFGQLSDETIQTVHHKDFKYERMEIFDLDAKEWQLMLRLGNLEKTVRLNARFSINSFPGVSAHVTDYARLWLYHYMKIAGLDNVFYCDTDSLIVNKEGSDRLKAFLDPEKLGCLKLHLEGDKVILHSLKDYEFGKVKKRKGVRGIDKVACDICNKPLPPDSKICPVCQIEPSENVFLSQYFPTLSGDLSKDTSERYKIKNIIKHFKRDYDKGIVTKTGRIEPFRLDG